MSIGIGEPVPDHIGINQKIVSSNKHTHIYIIPKTQSKWNIYKYSNCLQVLKVNE